MEFREKIEWVNDHESTNDGADYIEYNYTLQLQNITAPLGLTATQGNCNIELSWNSGYQSWVPNGCNSVVQYTTNIYRDGVLIASGINANKYIDSSASLIPGQDYTYTLKTVYKVDNTVNSRFQYGKYGDGITSTFSSQAIGSTKSIPPQPSSFLAF